MYLEWEEVAAATQVSSAPRHMAMVRTCRRSPSNFRASPGLRGSQPTRDPKAAPAASSSSSSSSVCRARPLPSRPATTVHISSTGALDTTGVLTQDSYTCFLLAMSVLSM